MKIGHSAALLLVLTFCSLCAGQVRNPQKRHLLVLGEEKGYRHDSVSHALATIERLGEKTGLWDTTIRTDTEALTKKRLEFNAKNLNDCNRRRISYPSSTMMEKASLACTALPSPLPTGRNMAR